MSGNGRGVAPGDPAPGFVLSTVHRDGTVSLEDYRGRSSLLLAFFRGIYCPFCRRQIAKLGQVRDHLAAAGIETLAVVASDLDRTRRYFRYRPASVPLAVDPAMESHQAFGVTKLPVTSEMLEALQTTRTDLNGELPAPVSVAEVPETLHRLDGFEMTPADQREAEEQFPMDTGQFLVDRDGIVRWANLDVRNHGIEGLWGFPSAEEILAAARQSRA